MTSETRTLHAPRKWRRRRRRARSGSTRTLRRREDERERWTIDRGAHRTRRPGLARRARYDATRPRRHVRDARVPEGRKGKRDTSPTRAQQPGGKREARQRGEKSVYTLLCVSRLSSLAVAATSLKFFSSPVPASTSHTVRSSPRACDQPRAVGVSSLIQRGQVHQRACGRERAPRDVPRQPPHRAHAPARC